MQEESKAYRAVINAGWKDAPWLSDDIKKELINSTPPHLIEARINGIPSIGEGNVYPIPYENIVCDPFEIPAHYRRIFAMDPGHNVTAVLWGAIDPDTDTVYIYAESYFRKVEEPAVIVENIKAKGEWIPGVIDPAARGRSQLDGRQLLHEYRTRGLKLTEAENKVEAGIYAVWTRLSSQKLRIFKNLVNFRNEYIIYHRDLNGKIVKENDHLMDCLRYLTMEIRRAKPYPVDLAQRRYEQYGNKNAGSRHYL